MVTVLIPMFFANFSEENWIFVQVIDLSEAETLKLRYFDAPPKFNLYLAKS